MIVLDIETSGTEPHKHSIVSIGAVEFENTENQFYEVCRVWKGAHVMPEALVVNGFTESEIQDPAKKTDKEIVEKFFAWALSCHEHTIAGHNPSFDRDFIKYTAERYGMNWPLAHRTIDLHSVCYFDMVKKGIVPPIEKKRSALNSDVIFKYVGLPAEAKPHIAITGAKLEAEALSRLFFGKALFPEFQTFPIFGIKR